jgi:hypothetical protein
VSGGLGREAAILVALASLGCRSEPMPPNLVAHVPATTATTPEAAEASPTPFLPSLEALASRASELAPGMREAARGEGSLPLTVSIPTSPSNACIRVLVRAGVPVIAALVTDGGATLDESRAGSTALVGAQGPVCLKRNQATRVEVQGPPGIARYVVWATP